MMDIELICRAFGLGTVHAAAPLEGGTSANVWRLDTEGGSYLLRTLPGRERGEYEWAIHAHLATRGFRNAPALIPTAEGQPCMELDGVWYQVQTMAEGEMPRPAVPGMAEALAHTVKALSAALADFPGGPVIHGDLGPWNLLADGDGALTVIDFGSARPGDPCFDMASLLGGIINHTPAQLRGQVCGRYVRTLDCDRARLLEQLCVWAAEGRARWAGKNEIMTARFDFAEGWAKEHLHEL